MRYVLMRYVLIGGEGHRWLDAPIYSIDAKSDEDARHIAREWLMVHRSFLKRIGINRAKLEKTVIVENFSELPDSFANYH